MKKFTKGFTLIELLVVIAIIGILSSVVLASLNTARDKGADAAAKANLNNMRAQAELFYDNSTTKSYTGLCSDPTVAAGVAAAASASGDTAVECAVNTGPTAGTNWATEVKLKGSNGYYCVDSTGRATTTSAGYAPTSTGTALDAACQ